MSKEVLWNKYIVETFVELAMLNELEEMILRTRISGMSRVAQAEKFSISISTVDRIIKQLKIKYDNVEKMSPLLPPRKRISVKD